MAAVRGGVIGAIEDAGFVDSYRSLHPYDGTDQSTLLAQPGRRVDYIFVDQSLTKFVSSSYILDNEGVGIASDHRPVVTEFRFGANDTVQDPAAGYQSQSFGGGTRAASSSNSAAGSSAEAASTSSTT